MKFAVFVAILGKDEDPCKFREGFEHSLPCHCNLWDFSTNLSDLMFSGIPVRDPIAFISMAFDQRCSIYGQATDVKSGDAGLSRPAKKIVKTRFWCSNHSHGNDYC